MFDISWSELMIVGVVALIAIGPKELPGVLRMIGQWVGKARKMASEFQGQFNEAMREAEMADLKKTFDDVRDAASDLKNNNLLTSMSKDVTDAMSVNNIYGSDKPASTDTKGADASGSVAEAPQPELLNTYDTPTPPAAPTDQTLVDAQTQIAASEPLIITREIAPVSDAADVAPATQTAEADLKKDARAS